MEKNKFWPGYFTGYIAGAIVFAAIPAIANSGEQDIEDVQRHNQEISEQLADQYTSLGNIVLDGDETFTFTLQTEDENPQECEGTYEIDNGTANVVGDIACTIVMPLDKSEDN